MEKHQKDEQEPEELRKSGGETTIQVLVVLPLLLACALHLHLLISPLEQSNTPIFARHEHLWVFWLLFVLIAMTAWAGASVDEYEGLHGLEEWRGFFKTGWRKFFNTQWLGVFKTDWGAVL